MGRQLKTDYTGKIYGCWEVIKRDPEPKSKSHETFWICKCQNCGNIASVRKSGLDKNPKSCNNCKGNFISQTMRKTDSSVWQIGDRYGLLTIIGKGTPKGKHTYVKVQCDCGSDPFEIRLEHLKGQGRHSSVLSCGCLTESAGEFKIRTLLEEANVNFQREYRVVDEDNKIMYFDFIILDKNNNIISAIEFDGEQHFKPIQHFGGKEAFIKQQERDKRKTEYCNTHGIFLKRIPYTEYNNINLEMLLS